MRSWSPTVVVFGLLAGLLAAQEPPKKLTPEEREKLVARAKEHELASRKARFAGKYEEAEKASRDWLAVVRELYPNQDHKEVAIALTNLAVTLEEQGRLAEAEAFTREALGMWKRVPFGFLGAALATTNLASIVGRQGKLAEAEQLHRDALKQFQQVMKGDSGQVAVVLNGLAMVLMDRQQLVEAEQMQREALGMLKRLHPKEDNDDVALYTNNLAEVLTRQGKFTDAEALQREALAMWRRVHKGDHPHVALGLNNLAGVLRDRGQFAEAEKIQAETLKMRLRLYPKLNHPDVPFSAHNLAAVLMAQGKFADAEAFFRKALEGWKAFYPNQDHPDTARTLNQLSVLLAILAKYDDSLTAAVDALKMRQRLHPNQDHPDVALSLGNVAQAHQWVGNYADAEQFHRDSLRMFRRLATAYAKTAAEGDALTMVASQPVARDGYLSNAHVRKPAPASVYEEVWSLKGAVSRVNERRQLAARAGAADSRTATLLAELTDARRRRAEALLAPRSLDPATQKSREAELDKLAHRIVALDRELRPLLPEVERAEKLDRATPGELQKLLPAEVVLVDLTAYTLYGYDTRKKGNDRESMTPRYLAFVVTRDKVAWVDLETADKIETAVSQWREAITTGKEIPPELPAKVRELVWEKVRKELPANIKTVYISPDAALCRVPWGALPGDKPGTILLEDFAIATIPHAPFLLDKLWEQDPIKNPPSGALVVGGVNFDAEATTGPANRDLPVKPGTVAAWQNLPGAAAEATGVESAAKKKGTVTSLSGEKATSAAVLAALPKAKYAHIATHGFFADPSFRSAFQLDEKDFARTLRGERIGRAALSPLVMTGLVFAGANNPKTPGRGIITGESLIDLDLSGLELAVLSACETGLGDVAGGEGTFGLQRAFHLAGTRDVVASLWKVPDAPTAALMAEFYRNLWEKNQQPLAALREAQLFIYRNPGKIADLAAGFRAGFKAVKGDDIDIKPTADGKAHPRLWAAFTLSGPGR